MSLGQDLAGGLPGGRNHQFFEQSSIGGQWLLWPLESSGHGIGP